MSDMPTTSRSIDIVVYDGVDELDVIGPMEVLRSAARFGADLTGATRHTRPPIRHVGAHGLHFRPDATYRPGGADITIVPGGGWVARDPRGAWGEVERGDWLPLLAEAHRAGSVLAGVCTGTMLLAHAGIVGNRPATTHHAAWDDLAATGAHVLTDRVVDDGDLITCGGVTSGIDLALHLVAIEYSPDLAERVATRIEHTSWLTTSRP
jgi:transcriptional regulator GlxA family with amidase domain